MAARATSTAIITFGLVTVPVKVYVAADAESVPMKMLTPAGNLVRQKNFDSVTGAEVVYGDCHRGYEIAKDQFLPFTKEELKALEGENTKTMDIEEFIDATDLNPVSIEKSYYLGPDKGGDKGYRLLAETLRGMGKIAIARWTCRGRDHLLAIRAHKVNGEIGLIFHQMFFDTEVRSFEELTGAKVQISDAERIAASQLVMAYSVNKFDGSKYKDGYVDRVMKAVELKSQNLPIEEAVMPAPKATVLDLLSALRASVAKKESK